MRVLVTGASGYVGRLAAARLAATGAEVHGVSRRPPAAAGGVTWHAADLLAPAAPERIARAVRPEAVLHCAWNATPGVYWTAPDNPAWTAATLALARAAFDAGARRFVGAGTCAEYDWTGGHCDEATTPIRPATPYGRAKAEAGAGVLALAAAAGATAAWARLFFLFGGDEHPARLVPSVARALLAGEPALCTHGEQVRDFLHVDDVAGALAALVDVDVGGAINIASGRPRRVRDVVEGLAARLGRPDLVRLGARPTAEAPRVTAAVARLTGEAGWRPALDFDAALDAAAAHWRGRAAAGALPGAG